MPSVWKWTPKKVGSHNELSNTLVMWWGPGKSHQISRVSATSKLGSPKTRKDLRSMFRLFNYYRVYIPEYSKVVSPLTHLSDDRMWNTISWSMEVEDALDMVKPVLRGRWQPEVPRSTKKFSWRPTRQNPWWQLVSHRKCRELKKRSLYWLKRSQPSRWNVEPLKFRVSQLGRPWVTWIHGSMVAIVR